MSVSWEQINDAISADAARLGVALGAPVGEESLSAAEEIIGRFPPTYRRFVAEFGWIETPAYTINGLGPDVPAWLDVVAETLSERDDLEPGLPDGYIVISAEGNGNVYCVRSVVRRPRKSRRSCFETTGSPPMNSGSTSTPRASPPCSTSGRSGGTQDRGRP